MHALKNPKHERYARLLAQGLTQKEAFIKCYHLLLLDDGSGQIAAQPNNRIVWHDDSFVKATAIPQYRVMPPITWHAEIGRNAQDTAFTQDK